MFKVSVMYPRTEGVHFDYEYYVNTHIPLVVEHLKPFGLQKTEVDKGVAGGKQSSPYVCIGHLYFDTADGYERGIAAKGPLLRGDIVNFTAINPVRQFSEILG